MYELVLVGRERAGGLNKEKQYLFIDTDTHTTKTEIHGVLELVCVLHETKILYIVCIRARMHITSTTLEHTTHDQPCNVSQYQSGLILWIARARNNDLNLK